LVKIRNFSGFFYCDACFQGKNDGWHVNLHSLAKIGKKKSPKNSRKSHKNEQEMTKMKRFLTKNEQK
jgi:hypothetical protein